MIRFTVFALLFVIPLQATEPPKAPSFEELIARYKAAEAQELAAKKAKADAAAEILKLWKDYSDKLAELGIQPGPLPIPDALAIAIKTAYTSEPAATRVADKLELQAVFLAIVAAINDPNISTAQQLFTVISGATAARIDGRLAAIRKVVGTELGKVLPSEPAAVLSARHKADAAAILKKSAEILEGIK